VQFAELVSQAILGLTLAARETAPNLARSSNQLVPAPRFRIHKAPENISLHDRLRQRLNLLGCADLARTREDLLPCDQCGQTTAIGSASADYNSCGRIHGSPTSHRMTQAADRYQRNDPGPMCTATTGFDTHQSTEAPNPMATFAGLQHGWLQDPGG
jgi:hypothetical protein